MAREKGEKRETAKQETKELDALVRRFDTAERMHTFWRPLWQECYDYALPARQGFYNPFTQGRKLTDNMFDMTASVSLQEFASRLVAGMTPTFSRWATLQVGKDVPKMDETAVSKGLDEITEEIFDCLHRSNFDSQVHESFIELGVGTGNLIMDEDPHDIFRFTAVPLTQVILDAGPFDTLDGRFRIRQMTPLEVTLTWPQAKLPDAWDAFDKSGKQWRDQKFPVIEATVRDWTRLDTEVHEYTVFIKNPKHILFEYTYQGAGSCPWINFRWSVAAGETYGRGPLLHALPDIKVVNQVVQDTLKNAKIAISGIWQAEDDGILNPSNIKLVPGTVIPIAQGSKGLQPLAAPGKFDVTNMILEELRGNIKRALYDEMLGPPTGTPMSATEVSQRTADLYRRIGSSYGRLQRELVQPVIRRAIYILKKKGRIKMPEKYIRPYDIVSVSPLASAQAQEHVVKFQQFIQTAGMAFGPQLLPLLIKPPEATQWLAEQFDVKPDLVNTGPELARQIQAISNAMAQQQAAQQRGNNGPQAGGVGPAAPGGAGS